MEGLGAGCQGAHVLMEVPYNASSGRQCHMHAAVLGGVSLPHAQHALKGEQSKCNGRASSCAWGGWDRGSAWED